MSQKHCLSSLISVALVVSSGLSAQVPVAPQVITAAILDRDADEYPAFNSGPTVEERISSGVGFDAAHNVYIIPFHLPEEAPMGRGGTSDSLSLFKALTYNSDAVVLATPILRRSALTASHKFVFSDYEIEIKAVYSDEREGLSAGERIVVTRPGGVVDLDGKTVRAIETEFPLFQLNQTYLFFLHRVSSGSYYVGPLHSFLLTNGTLVPGKKHSSPDAAGHSLGEVVGEIQAAAEERRVAR